MDIDSRIEVLQNMYDSLLQDKKKEEEKLNINLNRIQQINTFLNSVKDDPESDLRVFSPRSSESLHKEEIEECEIEKITLDLENNIHNEKITKLNFQIEEIGALITDISSIIKEEKEEIQEDDNKYSWMLIQERERQRIARELHDSPVQNLTHLMHMIELSSMFIEQDPIRAKLELSSCSQNLKSVIDEMREIIFNLRPIPFDEIGFKQGIEDLVCNLKLKFVNEECSIDFDICDIDIGNWKKEKEQADLILVTVYRVIQEAMTNSLKYSNANHISLKVNITNDHLFINVKDNGKGFSLQQISEHKDKHFGISVMRERIYLLNGDILIETEPEKGTDIKIEIPLL